MLMLPEQTIIEQIITGHHDDPFAVLGMHNTLAGLEVRVFLPNAITVSVINQSNQCVVAKLQQIDSRGFFAGLISRRKKRFDYLLDVNWGDKTTRIEDPYAFGALLSELDGWLLAEGKHLRPYERLGAHQIELNHIRGIAFTLWAPNAKRVSVVGEFNDWDGRRHMMSRRQESGFWELFIPRLQFGQYYKYELIDANGNLCLKSDPYALSTELRPNTASYISQLPTKKKMSLARRKANGFNAPISIYEVHLGSWRRHSENNSWLSYRELTEQLIPYVKEMGFTHIELMPITEHPFDGSWGYQPLGLYAPTSRYGSPEDFIYFIKSAHKAGLNVILDWVPGHFPKDSYGLVQFDGTPLYEYADPKEGYHPGWSTLIYNYGRYEVLNYLTGNALYWLERFDIDGLRVDAVSSMIYRNHNRKEGEWVANHLGGTENLEAIAFLQEINQIIGNVRPGAITIAEEATNYAGVTLPPENNGLGFHYKWNMGWMNDTLKYMSLDPIERKYHHNLLTFGMLYAYSENFILPLSHDEVVHEKRSLIDKMPGDSWQKFANLRAYYGYMWAFPGKKLLFMGNEFAQGREWNFANSLDWYLLDDNHGGWHQGIQKLVKDLNHCYQSIASLYQLDYNPEGFEWLVVDDVNNSIFVFARRDSFGNELIVISNFTPIVHYHYRIGIRQKGEYREIMNTDSNYYQGSNVGNLGFVISQNIGSHEYKWSIDVTVPPLATIYLLREPLSNDCDDKK